MPKKPKVLLIEDYRDVLEILEMEFSHMGCEIIPAQNKTEALEALEYHSDLDLIISDYDLGGTTAKDIFDASPPVGIPIIIYSDSYPGKIQKGLINHPIKAIIQKPDTSQIKRILRTLFSL